MICGLMLPILMVIISFSLVFYSIEVDLLEENHYFTFRFVVVIHLSACRI